MFVSSNRYFVAAEWLLQAHKCTAASSSQARPTNIVQRTAAMHKCHSCLLSAPGSPPMAAALPHLTSARSVCPDCRSPLLQSKPSGRGATGLPPCHLLVRVHDFIPARSWQEGSQGKTNRSAEPFLLLWSCYWHSSLLAAPVALQTLPAPSQFSGWSHSFAAAARPRPCPTPRAASSTMGSRDLLPPCSWSWCFGRLPQTCSHWPAWTSHCRSLDLVWAFDVFQAPWLQAAKAFLQVSL